jgi:hypothetical protein
MLQEDPYRLDNMDTYSNILYVKEQKTLLSFLAHRVFALLPRFLYWLSFLSFLAHRVLGCRVWGSGFKVQGLGLRGLGLGLRV